MTSLPFAVLLAASELLRELQVEFGFEDGEHMAKDDDLKDLRSEPRFQALLALLQAAPASVP
jgi:hypothetical protein